MFNDSSLSDVGQWAVSIIALVQVWIIALIRYCKSSVIEIFESGSVELGYSNLGPTLGLRGTLRAVHKDVFVRRMRARVVNKKTTSTREFTWHAFRSPAIVMNAANQQPIEVASSFMLTLTSPFKYNVFFVDESFNADVGSKIVAVGVKWREFQNPPAPRAVGEDKAEIAIEYVNPRPPDSLFSDLIHAKKVTEEFDVLGRACYWEPGRYQLDLIVEATDPERQFTKSFEFEISEDEFKLLKLNVIAILRALCGLQAVYNFAFPKYQRTERKT